MSDRPAGARGSSRSAVAHSGGPCVVAFESRRAREMASLIARHGASAVVGPSMREVAPAENGPGLDLLARLEAHEVDVLVLMTGAAVRTLEHVATRRDPPADLPALLNGPTLVARGPKPLAELRRLGLRAQVSVPAPNTWQEVLGAVDAHAPVADRRVAVLDHGGHSEELAAGLADRGAAVATVPVYRWAMPEDRGPLDRALSVVARGGADAVLFTSGRQAAHALQEARLLGIEAAFRDGVDRACVASIGPVCSEALREEGLPVHLQAQVAKMGHLVREVAERLRAHG